MSIENSRITGFIIIAIIAVILFLGLYYANAEEITQLPIQGKSFRAAGDWLVYWPANTNELWLYNIDTGQNQKVPGSENIFPRDHIYPAIDANDEMVAISWCSGNKAIYYSEYVFNEDRWINYGSIINDDGQGNDTNRSSIAIGQQCVMIVAQSDYCIKSRYKPDGGQWQSIQIAYPKNSSEPAFPQVRAYQNKFYLVCSAITGMSGQSNPRGLALRQWIEGQWSDVTKWFVDGAPDCVDMAVNQSDGSIHVTCLEWCNDDNIYCRVNHYSYFGGQSVEEQIYKKACLVSTDNPPLFGIGVDDSGFLSAAIFDSSGNSSNSYRCDYRGHSWTLPVNYGEGTSVAMTVKDNEFRHFYNYHNFIYCCKFNLSGFFTPTPEPSNTPTYTQTATETPTEYFTPTHTATQVDTLTPTSSETPTSTETPTETATVSFTETPTETPEPTPTPETPATSLKWWHILIFGALFLLLKAVGL